MTSIPFSKRQEMLLVLFLLGMTLINVLSTEKLLPLLRNGYQDFTIFYSAARIVRSGQAHSLYDLSLQYRVQKEFAPDVAIRQAALPYNHPAFEALLFVPLTLLGYWPAYVLWSVLNLIFFVASLVLLRRHFPQLAEIPPLIFGLSAFSFFPLAMGIIQGQDVVLFLFLFVLTMICLQDGKDEVAGALLGVGLFRPQLAVPLLLLLAYRRWRVLVGFAPVVLVLAGVSIAMTGWRGPYDYVRFVLQVEGTKSRGFGSELVPNLRGLVQNLPGLHPSGTWATVLILLSSLAVFVGAARRVSRGRDSILFSSSLAAVTTILVNFHSLVYDLSLLLPLVFFLLFQVLHRQDERSDVTTRFLVFLLLLSPLYVFLWLDLGRFFLFALILLGLFLKMVLSTSPESASALA